MFTTLISGLCAYVVNHPSTTNLDEPMVVVGVIVGAKGNACRPVIAMFDDSATIPKRGSPLGPHKFEVKIGMIRPPSKLTARLYRAAVVGVTRERRSPVCHRRWGKAAGPQAGRS
jgi:hypothetical protein